MPPAAEHRRSIGGAKSFSPGWPIARTARTPWLPSNPSRSAVSSRTRSGCMIWVAASTSGSRIVGTGTIRALLPTVRLGWTLTARRTSFGPGPGRTTRVMCGRRTATVTTPTFDIQHTDFESRFLLRGSEEPADEDRPAYLAGRGAGVAVVRCPRARKASAKGRASIFRLAAERGDDQRGILVPFRSAQHGRYPCGRRFSEQRPPSFAG